MSPAGPTARQRLAGVCATLGSAAVAAYGDEVARLGLDDPHHRLDGHDTLFIDVVVALLYWAEAVEVSDPVECVNRAVSHYRDEGGR